MIHILFIRFRCGSKFGIRGLPGICSRWGREDLRRAGTSGWPG